VEPEANLTSVQSQMRMDLAWSGRSGTTTPARISEYVNIPIRISCRELELIISFQIVYNTTVENIERVNANKTWGFGGCYFLLPGQKICLSEGTPPFPAPVENAQCGPQINGTLPISNLTGWADMNPCPNVSYPDPWEWTKTLTGNRKPAATSGPNAE
jgi:hypothetical protein